MELLNHLRLRVLVLDGEPLVECLCRGKHLRQQEVEQRPQLVQVILERRPRDQQPEAGLEHANHLRAIKLSMMTQRAPPNCPSGVLQSEAKQPRATYSLDGMHS